MRIYQHVDELNDRDGIGNDIHGLQVIFEKMGLSNSIITRINNSRHEQEVYSSTKPPKFFSDDVHILHYGGVGYPLELFTEIPGKKILRFHNMTPVFFFKDFMNEDIYKTFERNEIRSYLELYSLNKSIHHILSDSIFNEKQYLKIVGERNENSMTVMPVIRNYPHANNKSDCDLRIGFIGRWAPNKKIEDLLFTIFFLKKINPKYKLVLLGKRNSVFQIYNNKLSSLMEELDITDSVEIHENLDDQEIARELSHLDLYLSMSEHEGFGIPILEAMGLRVPVLAFASSAVLETVRDAGILFTKKNFPLLSELIHKILLSSNLQDLIRKSQLQRIQQYNDFPFEQKLSQILRS